MWIIDFVLRIFKSFFLRQYFFLDSIIYPPKKFGDLTLSNIPPTNTITSFSTTSTSSILSTNRRSTGLHNHIYSRLWLFQIRTAASKTEAESICLFRISLSFRVQRKIVPLLMNWWILPTGGVASVRVCPAAGLFIIYKAI